MTVSSISTGGAGSDSGSAYTSGSAGGIDITA